MILVLSSRHLIESVTVPVVHFASAVGKLSTFSVKFCTVPQVYDITNYVFGC